MESFTVYKVLSHIRSCLILTLCPLYVGFAHIVIPLLLRSSGICLRTYENILRSRFWLQIQHSLLTI